MKKLTVKGCSKRKYVVDSMEIILDFRNVDKSTASAIENVDKSCEKFLQDLIDNNIKIENYMLKDASVSVPNYSSDKDKVVASKK